MLLPGPVSSTMGGSANIAATVSLKHSFAAALSAYLANAIPGLTINTEAADPEQKKVYPSVQVIPHKMRLMPFVDQAVLGDSDQTDEAVIGSNHDLVLDIGEWEGPVEIRLVARTAPEREFYQAAILAALNADEDRPGVTALAVDAVPFYTPSGLVTSNYTANGSVMLDVDEWQEEMVWEKHRFDFIEVEMQFPMLVLRRDVGNIEQLIVEATQDMDTEPVSDISADSIESVSVAEDGSIAPA